MFWVFSSFFLSLSLSSLFVLGDEESLDVRGWLEFKSVFEVEIVELLGGGGGLTMEGCSRKIRRDVIRWFVFWTRVFFSLSLSL